MSRLLLLRIIAAAAAGYIAYKKGRDRIIWALLGALFPPLVFVVLLLPPKLAPGVTKRCPYCSAVVYAKDTVCSHCMRELPIDMVKCGSCGSFVPDKGFCANCHRKL
jgi:predicted amidophosphoribosyltransferase